MQALKGKRRFQTMRILSKCMTLSAAGLLALGAASAAAAQQQQPRDSSIETGTVTTPDSVNPAAITTVTSSTINNSETRRPVTAPDSSVSGMTSDTNPSAVSPNPSSSATAADPNASSGMSTDTALKAKPGLQTGAAVSDTGGVSATSDTGGVSTTDTTATGKKHHKKGAGGYQYHGASSDSALHAKPGTQTGKTARDSTSMKPDSSR
jgi:hypothetical protein